MFSSLKKKTEGFTIIEVMIVLAIAGLIMAVVFIAIPQLQRNQRNSAMREAVNRTMSELENYASNNNGDYPRTDTATTVATRFGSVGPETAVGTPAVPAGTFAARYLGNIQITDPRTGLRAGLAQVTALGTGQPPAVPASGGRTINYWHTNGTGNGFRCNGETVQAGSGARNVAISVALEGGAVYCVDNS